MTKFQIAMYKSDFGGLVLTEKMISKKIVEENASALTPKKGMAMEENNQ